MSFEYAALHVFFPSTEDNDCAEISLVDEILLIILGNSVFLTWLTLISAGTSSGLTACGFPKAIIKP